MTEADKDSLNFIIFIGFCMWMCIVAYWMYLNPLPHKCLQNPQNPNCTAEHECEECWLDSRVP